MYYNKGMEEISNKILKNYLLGKCSPREMERLTAWARESDEHARWLFRMTDAYHAYRASHQVDEAHVQRAELDLLNRIAKEEKARKHSCLLYTSDAADDHNSV